MGAHVSALERIDGHSRRHIGLGPLLAREGGALFTAPKSTRLSATGSRMKQFSLAVAGVIGSLVLACSDEEAPLGNETRPADASDGHSGQTTESRPEPTASESSESATSAVDLPGSEFVFELTGDVYLELAGPSIVADTDVTRTDWDLHFDGFDVFTNGGVSGAGEGAAFGPSTDLDILFDTVPEVPLRADASDGAMNSWFWYSDAGIASRFHIYAVRARGRVYKIQILAYYGGADASVAAQYSIRYAEITEAGPGEIQHLMDLDAAAGGVDAPPSAPAACLSLQSGDVSQLTSAERSLSLEWDICFQRTEVLINGGLSGKGDVRAVDLDWDVESGRDLGLTEEETTRNAESELERFSGVAYDDITAAHLPWDKQYAALPRIGQRWLSGRDLTPVPGTWFVRDASGARHFAVLFTNVVEVSGGAPRVEMQIKALVER